jgi:exopolysaccharide production protein ExoQ
MVRTVTPTEQRFAFRPNSGDRLPASVDGGLTRASVGPILAIVAVCSLFSGPLIGTIGIAIFVAASGALMMWQPFKSGRDLLRYSPFLLIPLLALISTAWSDAPERTSRAALELLVTVAAVIVITGVLSARAMILTLFVTSIVVCLATLPYVPNAISVGMPLHGPFDTKNPMGFAMVLALGLGLIVMLDKAQPVVARICAIPLMGVSLFLLVLTQSGNAFVGAAIIFFGTTSLLVARYVGVYARIGIVVFLLALGGVGLVFLSELQIFAVDFVENVLKKDMTFTGRTYIWEVGSGLIAERPSLGHGYYAFWRQGNVEAEALWREFGIAKRSGFTFHSAFVEMAVDLGLVGLGIFLALCVGTALKVFFTYIKAPTLPAAFFFALMVVLFLRSYTETGLVGPFSIYTALWIWAFIYSTRGQPMTDRA